MNVTQKKARDKFTHSFSSFPDKRVIKLNRKAINRYERVLAEREINDELMDYTNGQDTHQSGFYEDYSTQDIPFDNVDLPDGVTLE